MNSYSKLVDEIKVTTNQGTYKQRRIPEIKVVDAFAARKISTQLEALLLELNPNEIPRISDWPMSEGFYIEYL